MGRVGRTVPRVRNAQGQYAATKAHSSRLFRRAVQLRLKSIKNIGKITKSMKMIASTKLNRAQKAMDVGRAFGQSASGT